MRRVEKPSAVRRTVVTFCKNNKISVREFFVLAKKTRLASTNDEVKMAMHFRIWQNHGWV
jgi:hypothetical protein